MKFVKGLQSGKLYKLTDNKETIKSMSSNSPLEQSIIDVVKQHFNITLNDEKVKELVENECKKYNKNTVDFASKDYVQEFVRDFDDKIKKLSTTQPQPAITTIRIEQISLPTVEMNVAGLHFNTPKLLQYLVCRLPVYMFGPTGSSKTNVVFRLAKQLGLLIQSSTVSPQTPKSELLGYNDANGKYVEGVCYKPFTEGGILLINELDNGNAASNAVLNQLMDEAVFFPCGMRDRHKDFCLVATANTLGNGANRQYVGRSPQDKALLNRFVYLHWPWDTKLEKRLATEEYQRYSGKNLEVLNKTLRSFWKLRQATEELQIDHILSMRNLLQYVRLLATGTSINDATTATISRGLNKEQWEKILAKAKTVELELDDNVFEATPESITASKKALGWDYGKLGGDSTDVCPI